MGQRTIDSFELLVSYAQVALFDENLPEHFNDWRDEHVKQGFSWRVGSVSFSTLESWPMAIEVVLADRFEPRPEAVRAIRVPFKVSPSSRIVVAVVGQQRRISIPAGTYSLTFEHAMDESMDRMWCLLTLVPDPAPTAAVLVADASLSPLKALVMTADPAWLP